MDYKNVLDFTIELVKILAWPVTVLIIVRKFEKEIKELIKDIKISLSMGDKKVEITHDKAEDLKQKQEDIPEKDELKELKEENKKHSNIERKLLELQAKTANDKDTYFLGYHFEKTYRLIFGSQLAILNLIYQHGRISDALAQAIYRRTTWSNSYPYQDYIGFLVNSGLINSVGSADKHLIILPVGKAFIDYLYSNNMSINKLPY